MTDRFAMADPHILQGDSLSQPGTYFDTLTSSSGCDSMVTLNLSVVSEIIEVVNQVICVGDSAFINGKWYAEAGSFSDTLASSGGCDSILDITIDIVTQKLTSLEETICGGESYPFGSIMLFESGEYSDTLTSASCCDSIVQLMLNVLSVSQTDLNANLCQGQTYTVGTEIFNETGEYDILLQGENGCDSMVHLTLIVSTSIETERTLQICNGDSVVVDGVTYNESGTYSETFPSAAGCDSTSILHIEFIDQIEETLSFNICPGDSILIEDINFGNDTTIVRAYTSEFGCDSIVTYLISLMPESSLEVFPDTICEGESAELIIAGLNYLSLSWSPSESLSCDDCSFPIATPTETTTYTVTGIGCG